jgi:hypothetical protein
MICATFHCDAKYTLSKAALNNWVTFFYSSDRQLFKNFIGDQVVRI